MFSILLWRNEHQLARGPRRSQYLPRINTLLQRACLQAENHGCEWQNITASAIESLQVLKFLFFVKHSMSRSPHLTPAIVPIYTLTNASDKLSEFPQSKFKSQCIWEVSLNHMSKLDVVCMYFEIS